MPQRAEDVQARLFDETQNGRGRGRGSSAAAKKAQPSEFGLKSPSLVAKNFVLDTNVLLHDPACLGRFTDNHICIPVDVLAELDRFKSEQTERGANARKVHRKLTETFSSTRDVTRGVPTDGGGTLRLVIYDPSLCPKNSEMLSRFHRIFPDTERVDHRILACTLLLMAHNKAPVVLVTKDLNMQLKARSVGIECQDYLNDKVDPREVSSYEVRRIEVESSELQRFASSGELTIEPARRGDLVLNQYVLLEAGEKQTMPARVAADGRLVRLQIPEALKIQDGAALKPMNLGQRCLIDALLNPDISLVTCYGQAGTGKTLVAVAAGLHEMFNRRYNGLTVSRPVVAMGDQLGFLPGTLDEKMRPWLQPIHDALDLLMRPAAPLGPRRKQPKKEGGGESGGGGKKPWEVLMEQGIIEVEALCYIRGRSIPNRFFVLDEAQQLTPQEAKTVVTRMSRGSKLVLVGDPAQIDNPYVDSRSNGLVYTRNRLKGLPFVAHVSLSRGERSELADAGAQLM
ncbi:MAG: PhoH family protein [Verrucomicrobia bacterium]|nr:MAG: PhoH family protein [Verrucomicrobiota bacterium]TAE89414.1 MAG: PhoH family protein [Verrucomicrobiota bacterium]TAF28088.1 MAG: PhoH family protein [Verrucomicrobiota bacterium]TAF42934.1 MAG: PhoH family protein [Verrucomicrobiota bacterium]